MRTSAAGCLASLALAAIAVAGCAADAGDTARFCGQVAANQEAILALPTTADDIDDFVSTYRTIGESAPLAIEQDVGRPRGQLRDGKHR